MIFERIEYAPEIQYGAEVISSNNIHTCVKAPEVASRGLRKNISSNKQQKYVISTIELAVNRACARLS